MKNENTNHKLRREIKKRRDAKFQHKQHFTLMSKILSCNSKKLDQKGSNISLKVMRKMSSIQFQKLPHF